MPLALADNENTYWTVLLVLGAVVIVAVVVLLSLLIYFIRIIDRRVARVRETLEAVSDNTRHADLVGKTADEVDAVLAEGLRHHLFLGRAANVAGAGAAAGEVRR